MTDDSAGPTPKPRAPVEVDATHAFGARALGCLLGFAAFILLLSLPEILHFELPLLIWTIFAMALGVGCVHLYTYVARARWGITTPDVVQLLERDLGAIRRRRLDDFRLRLGGGWSWRERAFHELVYAMKWLGHLLIFAGAGTLIYRIMVLTGLVHP